MREYLESVEHSDFVEGYENKTLGFVLLSDKYVLQHAQKNAFTFYACLYQIAPLVLVPILALSLHSWLVLTGILLDWIASFAAANKIKICGPMLLLGTIFFAFRFGFWSIPTILCVCAFWGFFWFEVTEQAREDFATDTLLKNKEIFDTAQQMRHIVCCLREQ